MSPTMAAAWKKHPRAIPGAADLSVIERDIRLVCLAHFPGPWVIDGAWNHQVLHGWMLMVGASGGPTPFAVIVRITPDQPGTRARVWERVLRRDSAVKDSAAWLVRAIRAGLKELRRRAATTQGEDNAHD